MPRNVVVSVGKSWGRPGTRTCGISVGDPEASAGSRSRPFRGFGSGLPGRVRGPRDRQLAVPGLPNPADPGGLSGIICGQVPAGPLARAGTSGAAGCRRGEAGVAPELAGWACLLVIWVRSPGQPGWRPMRC